MSKTGAVGLDSFFDTSPTFFIEGVKRHSIAVAIAAGKRHKLLLAILS